MMLCAIHSEQYCASLQFCTRKDVQIYESHCAKSVQIAHHYTHIHSYTCASVKFLFMHTKFYYHMSITVQACAISPCEE